MTSQNNALVEIALALAMTFFSIMVLAMVSMSVSGNHPKAKIPLITNANAGIDVRPSSPPGKISSLSNGAMLIAPDEVIIFFDGKFYNADLKQVAETDINQPGTKFLAVNPSMPTVETVKIRKKFSSNSLVVTLLNDEWLRVLKEKKK